METFSMAHQAQVLSELRAHVGNLIHLYGLLQQPYTVAKLLAVETEGPRIGQILIRTDDGMATWESWHWTVPLEQRQQSHTAFFGPQIEAMSESFEASKEVFRRGT